MTTSPRILALVGATVALAVAFLLASWSGAADGRFAFWFGACLLGELLWVRMPVGRATVSMASCFHFAAVLALPAGQAMAATALSGLLAELVVLRKAPLRAVFNSAQSALAVGAAAGMLALTPGDPMGGGAGDLLRLLAAGAAYFVVNTGAVSAAVALSEGITPAAAWRANFGNLYEVLSNGALFSLGTLVASGVAAHGPVALVVAALPLWVAFEGYRRSTRALGAQPPRAESAEPAAVLREPERAA